MNQFSVSRRSFLASACSLAAAPLLTNATFAALPGENRFITIILRGALDSLYLVQPYTDPLLARYRSELALSPTDGLIDLDGQFGLHPDASALMPLYRSGELAFVHAVSTPYRNTRSHFDGQDILETGGTSVDDDNSGWLNRALSAIPDTSARKAIDISVASELVLQGPNPVDIWSADTDLTVNPDEMAFFTRLYQNDPAFAEAFAEASATDSDVDASDMQKIPGANNRNIARLAARMLASEYRIASFSINGWDTHAGQKRAFRKPLNALVTTLLELRNSLGPQVWSKTAVLAMTEFGRTVRQNGSKGTDHGTGGLAILAGGAIRGGKVYGKWPGLSEDRLFENRDLMPTGDVREIAAALLYSQFNIGLGSLTGRIFPGLEADIRSQAFLRG